MEEGRVSWEKEYTWEENYNSTLHTTNYNQYSIVLLILLLLLWLITCYSLLLLSSIYFIYFYCVFLYLKTFIIWCLHLYMLYVLYTTCRGARERCWRDEKKTEKNGIITTMNRFRESLLFSVESYFKRIWCTWEFSTIHSLHSLLGIRIGVKFDNSKR